MKQNTDEWRQARLGHVTASRFADVMTQPKTKIARANGQLSQTAMSYLRELRAEWLTGTPEPEIVARAIEHGNMWEPAARQAYAEYRDVDVVETGFVVIDPYLIGCSPDGLVGDDGLIEIKCPYTRKEMEKYRDGEIDTHEAQIQGQLWITDRRWCDFVAYHPDYPKDYRLIIHRVERDGVYISDLRDAVMRFHDRMAIQTRKLLQEHTHARVRKASRRRQRSH